MAVRKVALQFQNLLQLALFNLTGESLNVELNNFTVMQRVLDADNLTFDFKELIN